MNVTMALGIDGPKEQHDKIRQKPGSWDIVIDTARQLQTMKKEYPRLDVQTCTCFMHSNQDVMFEWYDFLKHELKPDKVNFNYIRPPAPDPQELEIDPASYAKLGRMNRGGFAPRRDQESLCGRQRIFQSRCRYLYARLDCQDGGNATSPTEVLCGNCRRGDLRRGNGFFLRKPRTDRQFAGL